MSNFREYLEKDCSEMDSDCKTSLADLISNKKSIDWCLDPKNTRNKDLLLFAIHLSEFAKYEKTRLSCELKKLYCNYDESYKKYPLSDFDHLVFENHVMKFVEASQKFEKALAEKIVDGIEYL